MHLQIDSSKYIYFKFYFGFQIFLRIEVFRFDLYKRVPNHYGQNYLQHTIMSILFVHSTHTFVHFSIYSKLSEAAPHGKTLHQKHTREVRILNY